MLNRDPILAVLVVEDEWLVRDAIASYLRDAGCHVLEAADGEAALALVENGAHVDVLLTDITLSGRLDGWDVGEALRALRPAVAVIYVSGAYREPRRPVAGSIEFDKPYSPAKVLYACRCMGNGGGSSHHEISCLVLRHDVDGTTDRKRDRSATSVPEWRACTLSYRRANKAARRKSPTSRGLRWRRNMRQHEAAASLPRLVLVYDDAIRAIEVTFVGLTFGKSSGIRLIDLAGALDALARRDLSQAVFAESTGIRTCRCSSIVKPKFRRTSYRIRYAWGACRAGSGITDWRATFEGH